MKITFGKTIASVLILGLVAGGAFFATRKPPRHGRHSSTHAHRPESASDSAIAESTQQIESEIAGAKLISAANSTGPNNAEPSLEWSRFRGPNGTGVSMDTAIPTQWSDTQNLRWKTKLPGPGSSSPVLTNQHVFLTSYTGYGEEGLRGQVGQLKRQIHCIDRKDGNIVWSRTIDAAQPEDAYQGKGLPEHGYATNSMVTDGKAVYAFLGKSGVFAYDMAGNELWKVSVGTQSGNRGWGTAASLILYKDILIVNAAEESQNIFGINKNNGEVVWKAPGSILELAYGTPVIARVSDNRDDLVVAVPSEVWGLNPSTGKLVWFVETKLTGNLSPSVVPDGDKIYVFGGFNSSGSLAIKLGGKGDVTKSNTLWSSRNSSYVVTPVLHEGNLYWINDKGIYNCMSTETGELLDKQRVSGIESGGNPVYASPVAINGKLYMQTRTSGLFVLDATPKMNVLKQNRFASDNSVFNATPAVSNGQLFLRSYNYLYCIMAEAAK
jgi:hypothetical protein